MPRVNVKDKRKQQLMVATMDSIAKRGLSETTITHISKGAGMSRGIINFYFTSKEQMLRETLGYVIEEYESVWQTATDKVKGGAKDKLEALVECHFSKKLCNAKRLNVLSAFWAHAASHTPYREQLEKSDAKLRTVLERYLGEIGTAKEASANALRLHALIRGLWVEVMLGTAQADTDVLCNHVLSTVGGKPKASKKAAAKIVKMEKKAEKEKIEGQMDIEDLFAAS